MNLKRILANSAKFFLKPEVQFGLAMTLATFFILWYVNENKDPDGFKWHDVIVESHGILFDLLVFNVLLPVYLFLREKGKEHDEIDNFRGWSEKEAMFRIVSAIKRLNKAGESKIDLAYCYLDRANLFRADLFKANLWRATLAQANLEEANLEEANLEEANLEEANLEKANLEKANLYKANFRRANLKNVNLLGALVGLDWFEKLYTWEVIGITEITDKYKIDENGIIMLK